MQRKQKTDKIKVGMATAGIFTGLGLVGTGIGLTVSATNLTSQFCESTASSLGSLLTGFINRTVTVPQFVLNLTADLPSQFPFSGNASTPIGIIPVSGNVSIDDLRKLLIIPIGPFAMRVEDIIRQFLGAEILDSIYSIPSYAGTTCANYFPLIMTAIGTALTLYLAWQVASTFGFGSKILEHDVEIKELQEKTTALRPAGA